LLCNLSVKVFILNGIEVLLESCSGTQKTAVEFHMHISAKKLLNSHFSLYQYIKGCNYQASRSHI
jgi:recombinational DNA repair protein (RecF pathway)